MEHDIMYWVWLAVKIALGLIAVFGTFFTVDQQEAAVIQRFGKFVRVATSGLNMKIPFIDSVAGELSLRVEQLDIEVETKTKDDVFVKVMVSVQNFVMQDKVHDAFYQLSDPAVQIESYVLDTVRAKVPNMDLDDAFANKDEIADNIKTTLAEAMAKFGYGIEKALVTDIEPDPKVKEAMNEINAQKRLRIAATEKGEANRILRVKDAEAESASKKLQGEGIAAQRAAIVNGLKESIAHLQQAVPGATAADVMQMVMITQYFDTLSHIGSNSRTNAILIPTGPGAVKDLTQQLRDAMITADQVTKVTDVQIAAAPAPAASTPPPGSGDGSSAN